MKKEFLKGFTMLVLIMTLALAAAVVSANGQSANRMVANIPFEFVVGGESMPSGEYSVNNATTDGSAILIQSADAKNSAIRFTNAVEEKARTNSRLVFHRYGQRYFLAEVWKGDSTGRQLLKSRQERAIERELASLSPKSESGQNLYEIVEVAALR
ncbi:MAG: hypothetical protein ABR556_00880 [Pyrinomonadaceae bacterium]